MLIQKEYNKKILLEIKMKLEIQQCFLLLKNKKKTFYVFHKEL